MLSTGGNGRNSFLCRRARYPHRSGPLPADGDNTAEIDQLKHGEHGLQRVSVDAHRRRDVRGGLLRVLFLLGARPWVREAALPSSLLCFAWFIAC